MDTYRTICVAPSLEIRAVFEGIKVIEVTVNLSPNQVNRRHNSQFIRRDGKLVLTHEGMVQGDYSGKFMTKALLEQYAL